MRDINFPRIPQITGRLQILNVMGYIRITAAPIYCGHSTSLDYIGRYFDVFVEESIKDKDLGVLVESALNAWVAIDSREELRAIASNKGIWDSYWNKAVCITNSKSLDDLFKVAKVAQCTRGNGRIFWANGIRLQNGDFSICPPDLAESKTLAVSETASLDEIGKATINSLNMMVEETLESIRAAQDKLT